MAITRESDFDYIYIGDSVTHQIKVSWNYRRDYESAGMWDDGHCEESDFNVTLQSCGDYPLSKEILNMMVETDAINAWLKDLPIGEISNIEVDDTNATDYLCVIDDLKDEIKVLESRKKELAA